MKPLCRRLSAVLCPMKPGSYAHKGKILSRYSCWSGSFTIWSTELGSVATQVQLLFHYFHCPWALSLISAFIPACTSAVLPNLSNGQNSFSSFRNPGPFHQQLLPNNSVIASPLVPCSAGFSSVEHISTAQDSSVFVFHPCGVPQMVCSHGFVHESKIQHSCCRPKRSHYPWKLVILSSPWFSRANGSSLGQFLKLDPLPQYQARLLYS